MAPGPGKLNDPQNLDRYHFWSLHQVGGLRLFGEGHVQFISHAAATVPSKSGITVLEAPASRGGGETISP